MKVAGPVGFELLAFGIPDQIGVVPLQHIHSAAPELVAKQHLVEELSIDLTEVDHLLNALEGMTPNQILSLFD